MNAEKTVEKTAREIDIEWRELNRAQDVEWREKLRDEDVQFRTQQREAELKLRRRESSLGTRRAALSAAATMMGPGARFDDVTALAERLVTWIGSLETPAV